jgi:pyridoxal 5'-phosphate synthase pdxT subunit
MDSAVRRNAFRRQVQGFGTDLDMPELGQRPFAVVFIRAPKIIEAVGPCAHVLANLDDGTVVAGRQDNLLATCWRRRSIRS